MWQPFFQIVAGSGVHAAPSREILLSSDFFEWSADTPDYLHTEALGVFSCSR